MIWKLFDNELLETEKFSRSGTLFGWSKTGDYKLYNFIVNKQVPEIEISVKNSEENFDAIIKILKRIDRHRLGTTIQDAACKIGFGPAVYRIAIILITHLCR